MRTLLITFIIITLPWRIVASEKFQWEFTKDDVRHAATESGIVRGLVTNNEYISFLGIPYAVPPTGKRRFKPPMTPALSWNGILPATRTVKCPQYGRGDEDCLILNIFTPIICDETLPVVFFIHGGYFVRGSGPTSGVTPLINENLVVVTINYRVGALGFLCLGLEDAPGNAGLKDQLAALIWVQRNIKNFGGDPNRVTIYGEGTGGACVEYHILSKLSRGLFHNAIIESGSIIPVWATDAEPIKTATNFAGVSIPRTEKEMKSLISFYRYMDINDLSRRNIDFFKQFLNGTYGFMPCVEKNLGGIHPPFITDSPYELLVKERFDKIPVMFVFGTLEGLFLRSNEIEDEYIMERMNKDFNEFLPADLVFKTNEKKNSTTTTVKNFYFGDASISELNLLNYLNYFGDHMVLYGLLNSVEIHSRKNTVYLLEFAYKGKLGKSHKLFEKFQLAGHGDFRRHVFVRHTISNPQDKVTVSRLTKLLSNFIKNGDPTPEKTQLLPLRWPSVQSHNVTCMFMDQNFRVIEEPHWGTKIFWDLLYSKNRRTLDVVDTGVLA